MIPHFYAPMGLDWTFKLYLCEKKYVNNKKRKHHLGVGEGCDSSDSTQMQISAFCYLKKKYG